MNTNRFLLSAIIMLAMIFTYSCSSTETEDEKVKYYYAVTAKTLISYTSLYPNVIMEPEGYFLNEMAQYGERQYAEDMCNYYLSSLDADERAYYSTKAAGLMYNNPVDYCISHELEQDRTLNKTIDEVRNWIKSADTPFYNDINSEIFAEGNSKFLGFYQVDGQEHYIFVSYTFISEH